MSALAGRRAAPGDAGTASAKAGAADVEASVYDVGPSQEDQARKERAFVWTAERLAGKVTAGSVS